MSKARVYARNLAANWVGHGASLVVLFFLSPFIVHTLGTTEYGIWSLLTVLTGYMGMLDLGVRASTGRYIILYLGREDHASVDETIRTGLGFFSAIGLLIVAVGACLGWTFPSFFSSVPPEYHRIVKFLLPLLALNVRLSACSAVFSSVLAAHDRFDLTRGVDLTVLVIRTAGIVYVLSAKYGIVGLSAVVIICNILGLVGNWWLAKRIYPRCRIWPLKLTRTRLRELFGYGIAAFLSAVAYKVINQTDLIVVGAAISVPLVTIYSIGGMLVLYSTGLIGQIGTTLFPPIQRAAATNSMEEVRWLCVRQARLGLLCGLPVYIGFIFLGRQFIILWMGPEYIGAVRVVTILSFSAIVALFSFEFGSVLAATGYIRFCAVLYMIEAGANLGLSLLFVLVFNWGLAGVAAGTLAALVLVRSIIYPAYACYRLKLPWQTYLGKIVGPGLAAGAVIALCSMFVHLVIPGRSWPTFFVQVACVLAVVPLVGWFLLISTNDKRRILRVFGFGKVQC